MEKPSLTSHIEKADIPVVVHMWERLTKTTSLPEHLASRKQEVMSILGVMANQQGAHYCDRGYWYSSPEHPKQEHYSRSQSGTEHGIIGLATSPLLSHKDLPLFSRASHSGIIFVKPTLVMVNPYDGWTTYYDTYENMPEKAAYDAVCTYLEKAGKNSYIKGHHAMRDSESLRKETPKKMVSARSEPQNPMRDILEMQGLNPDAPYQIIDPLDQQVQQRALATYHTLMQKIREGAHPPRDDTFEINVNANLTHIGGIFLYHKGTALSESTPLAKSLSNDADFCKDMYCALQEHAWVSTFLKEHGIKKPIPLMLHQRDEQQPVHELRVNQQLHTLVNATMTQHGLVEKISNQRT